MEKEQIMQEFNVLVVDDEAEFRELTVKRLARHGLETLGADSGGKALEILKDRHIDVVLLDFKMPGMDGIETLGEIRRLRPLVEVLVLTGHTSLDSRIKVMELGAFDYLMKPIDLEPLLEKLASAFAKKKTNQDKIEHDDK